MGKRNDLRSEISRGVHGSPGYQVARAVAAVLLIGALLALLSLGQCKGAADRAASLMDRVTGE